MKPEMMGHYLGEFSISYKPIKHSRPGIGATHCRLLCPASCMHSMLTKASHSFSFVRATWQVVLDSTTDSSRSIPGGHFLHKTPSISLGIPSSHVRHLRLRRQLFV